MSLARRYRPQKFHQIAGQDPICRALLQCLQMDNAPHAFLFSGIRGTGKTTIARLYAAALNCTHDAGFEACPGCPSCVVARSGCHEDIIEIDGASHNSVEDIRELRENVLYMPKRSAYKIYIIDEIHMLSKSAFNALLKTLEEPPRHVVFLFATTELAKLPATVVGRCQSFHLRRIPRSLMQQRLIHILQQEDTTFEEPALGPIMDQAEGSLRDALNLLDQGLALGGGSLTLENMRTLLCYVPVTHYFSLWTALLERHPENILTQLHPLHEQGIEPRQILEQLALTTRHAWIIRSMPKNAPELGKLDLNGDEQQTLRSLCAHYSLGDLHTLFRVLTQGLHEFTASSLDRYILENTLLEWTVQKPPFTTPQQASTTTAPPSGASHTPPDTTQSSHATAAQKTTGTSKVPSSPPSLRDGGGSTLPPPHQHQSPSSSSSPSSPTPTPTTPPHPSSATFPNASPAAPIATAMASSSPNASASPPQADSSAAATSSPVSNSPSASPAPISTSTGPATDTSWHATSWEHILLQWEKEQPIQASEISAARVVEFSATSIVLMVNMDSPEGQAIHQRQHVFGATLKERFHFPGVLRILGTSDQHDQSSYHQLAPSLKEQRQHHRRQQEAQKSQALQQSPLAQFIAQEFPSSKMNIVWHNH